MGYKKPCYKNSINGIEHFTLVIQIIRVEIIKGVPRTPRLKKLEGKNKDSLFQN